MKIKKLALFDYKEVVRAGEIEAFAFQELKELSNGLEIVINFRSKNEKIIKELDRRWVILCDGDLSELTEWANRMRSICRHQNELDRHIAVKGTKAFDWDIVGSEMGYLNAQRVAIEQVLSLNEIPANKV